MNVLIKGNKLSVDLLLKAASNCNGQCSSDSSWCSYNPDSNCWNNGD